MYYKSIGNINLPFNFINFYFRKKKRKWKGINKETDVLVSVYLPKYQIIRLFLSNKKIPFYRKKKEEEPLHFFLLHLHTQSQQVLHSTLSFFIVADKTTSPPSSKS
jgi:hypothetical protein